MSNRTLVSLVVVAGLILIVVSLIYFTTPAGSLPGFFPGHEVGSAHHHAKHGLAALLLGLACFVFVWFRTGPQSKA